MPPVRRLKVEIELTGAGRIDDLNRTGDSRLESGYGAPSVVRDHAAIHTWLRISAASADLSCGRKRP